METLQHKGEQLKRDMTYLVIVFFVFLAGFKIIFNKEDSLVILRTAFSIFYLLVIPGFSLMWIWLDSLDFLERLVIGIGLSGAIMVVFGYNLRLIGLLPHLQVFILPPLFIAIGIAILLVRKN